MTVCLYNVLYWEAGQPLYTVSSAVCVCPGTVHTLYVYLSFIPIQAAGGKVFIPDITCEKEAIPITVRRGFHSKVVCG